MIMARECRFPNKPPRNAPDVFVFKIRITVGTTVNTPNITRLLIERGSKRCLKKV